MDAIEFVKSMQEVFAVPFWIDDKGQRADLTPNAVDRMFRSWLSGSERNKVGGLDIIVASGSWPDSI